MKPNKVFKPKLSLNLANFLEISKFCTYLDHMINCTRYTADYTLTETKNGTHFDHFHSKLNILSKVCAIITNASDHLIFFEF